MGIRTKNIYDPPSSEDGLRLLVMRKWPRGVPRQRVDRWEKELGPSLSLLEDWRRGGLSWEEFSRRYAAEVSRQQPLITALQGLTAEGNITLLCGCRDEAHCHRSLLKEIIDRVEHSFSPGPGREPPAGGK